MDTQQMIEHVARLRDAAQYQHDNGGGPLAQDADALTAVLAALTAPPEPLVALVSRLQRARRAVEDRPNRGTAEERSPGSRKDSNG